MKHCDNLTPVGKAIIRDINFDPSKAMHKPTKVLLWCFHTRARQRQTNKTNVEPVYSYAFHTRSDKDGVKGIIGMHRFHICVVVVLLWCENTITLTAIFRVLTIAPYEYYFYHNSIIYNFQLIRNLSNSDTKPWWCKYRVYRPYIPGTQSLTLYFSLISLERGYLTYFTIIILLNIVYAPLVYVK